jgi:hypothetical protein
MAKPQSSLSTAKVNRFRIKHDRDQRLLRRRRYSCVPGGPPSIWWRDPNVWLRGWSLLLKTIHLLIEFWEQMPRSIARRRVAPVRSIVYSAPLSGGALSFGF